MGSIIPNVPVTQYLVSSPSTDLYKTPHGYKAACAFEAMPFLAFWFVPCLSYSVPWCFFGSWHSPLVQFRWVIPRWESPNGALCLIHPWLPVLSHSVEVAVLVIPPPCDNFGGWWQRSACWQPHKHWATPSWRCRASASIPSSHPNSRPLDPAFRSGLKVWRCCLFHLFDFPFWACKWTHRGWD